MEARLRTLKQQSVQVHYQVDATNLGPEYIYPFLQSHARCTAFSKRDMPCSLLVWNYPFNNDDEDCAGNSALIRQFFHRVAACIGVVGMADKHVLVGRPHATKLARCNLTHTISALFMLVCCFWDTFVVQ